MIVVLIIISVFFGISMVVSTVAAAILIANGKLTLPGTNHRRVMQERTRLTLLQVKLEEESMKMRIDDAIQHRINRAIEGPPPFDTAIVPKGESDGVR